MVFGNVLNGALLASLASTIAASANFWLGRTVLREKALNFKWFAKDGEPTKDRKWYQALDRRFDSNNFPDQVIRGVQIGVVVEVVSDSAHSNQRKLVRVWRNKVEILGIFCGALYREFQNGVYRRIFRKHHFGGRFCTRRNRQCDWSS